MLLDIFKPTPEKLLKKASGILAPILNKDTKIIFTRHNDGIIKVEVCQK